MNEIHSISRRQLRTIEEVKAFVLEHEANCQHRHVTYIELNGVRGTVCDDCDKLL